MSVRKRRWKTSKGEVREAWIVDYIDQDGDRHIETFERKKDADAYHDTVRVDVRKGIHTAPSKSVTVAEAADDWLDYVRAEKRERSTITQYKRHVEGHIKPRLGRERLATLTRPRVEKFREDLVASLSAPLARKVLVSFKSIIKDACRRGNVAHNVAEGVKIKASNRRHAKKFKIGVDIPTRDEIGAIIRAATGRARAFLTVAAFAGLRSSEIRGLLWSDVGDGKITVSQRANAWGDIGSPKTETSARTLPVGPFVINALKEWRLESSHKGKDDLIFADDENEGVPESHWSLLAAYHRAQVAGGVKGLQTTKNGNPVLDDDGRSVIGPKYSGLHALRHFYASLCINRKQDGGLELPPKVVQERLGHSSIVITLDVYGHLFPSEDDGSEMADVERAILG